MTLTSSVVTNNTAASGAGIENDPTASLEISGSTITGNAAGFQGGGLDNAGTATVTGSIVSNNSASAGGGINSDSFAAGEGTLTITNSSVTNNSAADGGGLSVSAGGGLGVPNCIVTIIGSTFANNAIGDSNSQDSLGGAINATGTITLNVSGSLFVGNTAVAADSGFEGAAAGGAIYMSNFGATSAGPFGNLNIANSTFLRNTVVGSVGYGGAMYIDVGITVAVTGTSFTGNTVTGDFDEEGGAVRLNVFSDLEQSSFTGCAFQGNAAVVPATSSVPESTATAERWPAKASVVH